MVKTENDCCNCAVPAYPCLGDSCPKRHSKHFYCDECGDETVLYEYDGELQLCEDCLLARFDVVNGNEE